jgi:hypothetical protein
MKACRSRRLISLPIPTAQADPNDQLAIALKTEAHTSDD